MQTFLYRAQTSLLHSEFVPLEVTSGYGPETSAQPTHINPNSYTSLLPSLLQGFKFLAAWFYVGGSPPSHPERATRSTGPGKRRGRGGAWCFYVTLIMHRPDKRVDLPIARFPMCCKALLGPEQVHHRVAFVQVLPGDHRMRHPASLFNMRSAA
jgi:hypothetical protein